MPGFDRMATSRDHLPSPPAPRDPGRVGRAHVAAIMSWSVETVSGDTPCGVAHRIAATKGLHQLPVLDRGCFDGIICACALAAAPAAAPVRCHCRAPAVTVAAHTSCDEALARMRAEGVSALPVLYRGFLIGIVTAGDLVRAGVLVDGPRPGCRREPAAPARAAAVIGGR